MKKILIFLISILFFLPFKVYAEEALWCSLENFNKIQKLASNITTSYTYEETIENNKGNAVFTVKISNLNNKFYLINKKTKEQYPSIDGELTLVGIEPNTKLEFQVMASGYKCRDYIKTVYVTTPPYNPYYLDKACEDYTDYKLCSKWVNVNIDYDTFVKTVSTYSKEIKQPEKNNNPLSFNEIIIQILLFLDEYRFQIILPIVVLTTLGIIIIKLVEKKNNFDFKLK